MNWMKFKLSRKTKWQVEGELLDMTNWTAVKCIMMVFYFVKLNYVLNWKLNEPSGSKSFSLDHDIIIFFIFIFIKILRNY